jgi:hypothetical protein
VKSEGGRIRFFVPVACNHWSKLHCHLYILCLYIVCIVTRFANNSVFWWCRTERRIIRFSNNARILRIISEFYNFFPNYFWIFFRILFFCFYSLTELRSLIRIIPNHFRIIPKLFSNYEFLTSPNRTWIIDLSL